MTAGAGNIAGSLNSVMIRAETLLCSQRGPGLSHLSRSLVSL